MTQAAGATTVNAELNRAKALELRLRGKTYRQIAAEGELKGEDGQPLSLTRVYELVQEGLAAARTETAENAQAVKELEIERCDRLLDKLEGLPFSARVADSILRVMERRSRLQGLDAPTKWEGSGPGGAPLLPPGGVVIEFVSPAHGPDGQPLPAPPSSAPPQPA